jgi:hypothetical protein
MSPGFRMYGSSLAAVLLMMLLILTSSTMTTARAAGGLPQQIIIKWRDAPQKQQAADTADTLKDLSAHYHVAFRFLRKTGVGGSVYKLDPVLPAKELTALLDALSVNPHVEYAEADSMLRTMPRN